MKFLNLLALVAGAAAFPRSVDHFTQPFEPQQPGDSRSPCPGLNALANHNYLPHNGRAITGPMMVAAFSKAMNFQANISQGAVNINFQGIGVDPSQPVDLEAFFVPNVTDHRCSIARKDFQHPIVPARIAVALDQTHDTIARPGTWGVSRLAIEHLTPSNLISSIDIGAGEGTNGLMFLSTSMDSHNNGNYAEVQARKDWIAVFMGEERFPVELGWKPQAVAPSVADLTGITNAITVSRTQALSGQ